MPQGWGDARTLAGHRRQDECGRGADTGIEFGANRFAVAVGLPQESHSNYMKPPDPMAGPGDYAVSSNNIGQIVAGRYNHVTKQEQR